MATGIFSTTRVAGEGSRSRSSVRCWLAARTGLMQAAAPPARLKRRCVRRRGSRPVISRVRRLRCRESACGAARELHACVRSVVDRTGGRDGVCGWCLRFCGRPAATETDDDTDEHVMPTCRRAAGSNQLVRRCPRVERRVVAHGRSGHGGRSVVHPVHHRRIRTLTIRLAPRQHQRRQRRIRPCLRMRHFNHHIAPRIGPQMRMASSSIVAWPCTSRSSAARSRRTAARWPDSPAGCRSC